MRVCPPFQTQNHDLVYFRKILSLHSSPWKTIHWYHFLWPWHRSHVVSLPRTIDTDHTLYPFLRPVNLSCPWQYSFTISLTKNKWNTITKNANEIQKISGRPPKWWPCLCKAITWCSWGGAVTKHQCTESWIKQLNCTLLSLKKTAVFFTLKLKTCVCK